MARYYEIDVSLLHIRPKIWRRFLFAPDLTFGSLNDAIQFVGPWFGEHLWHFRKWGRGYEVFADMRYEGYDDSLYNEPAPDAETVSLRKHLRDKGDRCIYMYDMGDSWEHEVKLRRIVEMEEKFVARLIGGERNFPPEDSGGVYGYYRALLAVGKHPDQAPDLVEEEFPDKEDLEEFREWLGDWDPEAFDLEAVKKQFDHPKLKTKKKPAPRKIGRKKSMPAG